MKQFLWRAAGVLAMILSAGVVAFVGYFIYALICDFALLPTRP